MLPQWFLIALIAPLIWSATYHIDKIAITKFGRGVKNIQLAIVTGLSGFFVILVLLALDPSKINAGWEMKQIVPAFAGGLCYLLGLFFYFIGISKEEATRVAPLYSFSPVIAIILGSALLGEQISPIHAVGISVVVAGGVLVDSRVVRHIFRVNWQVLLTILLSSTFFVLGSIGFKKAGDFLDFQSSLVWFFAGSVLGSLCLLLPPTNRKNFLKLFKTSKKKKLVGVMVLSNLLGNIGRAAHNYAILLVPIAFVQTIEAFESAFVLAIAILLMRFFNGLEPDDLSRKVLLQKSLSVGVIITGSLMLTL